MENAILSPDEWDYPATGAYSITPHDTNLIGSYTPKGVWVGGAGNITCELQQGGEVVFTNISAGTLLPFRFRIIKATGTTATALVAVY